MKNFNSIVYVLLTLLLNFDKKDNNTKLYFVSIYNYTLIHIFSVFDVKVSTTYWLLKNVIEQVNTFYYNLYKKYCYKS